jgi:LacI family transcriptional regulator
MKTKKITLSDIAKDTDVSSAAVSMILANKNIDRFSNETIQEVRESAKRLGYVKKKKGNNKKKLILLVAPTIVNPYYSTIIQAMEMKAIECGYDTITYNTYWDVERERELIKTALSLQVDGCIFSMIPQQIEVAKKLNDLISLVIIGDRQFDLGIDTVEINNFNAGRMIGQHYVDYGHKEIAYITTPLNAEHSARTERLRGLTSICKENDINNIRLFESDTIKPAEVLNLTEIEYSIGYNLTKKCLKDCSEVTAIVAMNDVIAFGALDAIKSMGYKVPQDFSVSGFDNIFPSKFLGIDLTTVEHHIIQRGKKAVQMLSNKIDDRFKIEGVTRVEYSSLLIDRLTVGPVRK